jgi:ribosome-associated translation inhibitor RaiA
MHIDVRFLGLDPSQHLREYAEHRLKLALGRRAREIDEVLVRLADVNGPRGGVDKRCQVTLQGRSARVVVDSLAAEATAAIDLAVARADRAFTSELERARASRRHQERWLRPLFDDVG